EIFRNGSCICLAYPRGMQQSAEDRKNLSEKKKEEEHLRLLSHRSSQVRIDLGGSLSSHIRASPSNEKGNSNSLIVVLGTSGCLNVDVTLLKSVDGCVGLVFRLSAIVMLVRNSGSTTFVICLRERQGIVLAGGKYERLLSAEDQKSLSEKKKKEEHLRLL
nr:hypothetical protein [Tanacetum cinerariifolium]